MPATQHHLRHKGTVCFLGEEGREVFVSLVFWFISRGKKPQPKATGKVQDWSLSWTTLCLAVFRVRKRLQKQNSRGEKSVAMQQIKLDGRRGRRKESVWQSEKKYLPQKRNLGAAVEAGDHKDYVTAETLGNSEAWTGKTYNKTLGRTETMRWQNKQ